MKNKRKITSIFLLIMWMLFIFYMSHQSGEVSSSQSDLIVTMFDFLGMNSNNFSNNVLTFLIRKLAHVIEYFILCYLFIRVFEEKYEIRKVILYSVVCTVLYAITDEIHQYFIPGRAMLFTDVLIDSVGAILAATIKYISYRKGMNVGRNISVEK